jgi:hypothetical protein
MRKAHEARIHWSAEQRRRGLPAVVRTIDPAWLGDARPPGEVGWNLVCEFARPPAEQGDPSLGRVHFLVDEAPHAHLRPGAWLRLFERATQQCARVEILD